MDKHGAHFLPSVGTRPSRKTLEEVRCKLAPVDTPKGAVYRSEQAFVRDGG